MLRMNSNDRLNEIVELVRRVRHDANNPITAALGHVDEVVFVIPRAFPHKPFEGASLEQRLEMLNIITAREPPSTIPNSARSVQAPPA